MRKIRVIRICKSGRIARLGRPIKVTEDSGLELYLKEGVISPFLK
jgi:hypothetical protein